MHYISATGISNHLGIFMIEELFEMLEHQNLKQEWKNYFGKLKLDDEDLLQESIQKIYSPSQVDQKYENQLMAKYFLKKSKKIHYAAGYKLQDAIQFVDKAIKLAPDFADALIFKAAYLKIKPSQFKISDQQSGINIFKEAIALLKKAERLKPESVLIDFHLTTALESLGQIDKQENIKNLKKIRDKLYSYKGNDIDILLVGVLTNTLLGIFDKALTYDQELEQIKSLRRIKKRNPNNYYIYAHLYESYKNMEERCKKDERQKIKDLKLLNWNKFYAFGKGEIISQELLKNHDVYVELIENEKPKSKLLQDELLKISQKIQAQLYDY